MYKVDMHYLIGYNMFGANLLNRAIKFMISKNVTVNNDAGIHCRPSSKIIQTVLGYRECSFLIKTAKGETNLRSILELISLGLEKGDEVVVSVSGKDEEKVCHEIAALFSFHFDFPP